MSREEKKKNLYVGRCLTELVRDIAEQGSLTFFSFLFFFFF